MDTGHGRVMARVTCVTAWVIWALITVLPTGMTVGATVTAPPEPQITAATAAVVDLATGSILWGRDIHVVRAPASLTKVLTAMVALDLAPLDAKITVAKSDIIGESSMGLTPGETLPLEALLYGLLLPSGNDAAMAIARSLGAQPGDASASVGIARFVTKMNAKALSLGAKETHITNPHGLDELNHTTSAYDLAIIGAAFQANPTLAKIAGTATYKGYGYTLQNTNLLLFNGQYPGIVGGKTGQTDDAGYNLMEFATKNGRKLLSVEMGSTANDAWKDAMKLLDYGFATPPPKTQSPGQGGAFAANTGTDATTNAPDGTDASAGTDSGNAGDMIPLPRGASFSTDAAPAAPASGPLDTVGTMALNLPLSTFTLPPPTQIDASMGLRYFMLTALAFAVVFTLYLRRQTIRVAFTELREEWQAALVDPPHLVATGPIPRIPAADTETQRPTTVASRFEEMDHSAMAEESTVARAYALQAVRQARAGKRVQAQQAFAQVVALEPHLEWGNIPGFWELPVTAYADLATAMIEADFPLEARTMLTVASLAYPGHREIRAVQAMLPRQDGPRVR